MGTNSRKEAAELTMDDIKLFRRGTKEIVTLVQTVRIVSGDIRMKLGIEKCELVNIQRGKVTRTARSKTYMKLGEEIKYQEMKKIKKEYITQLWKYYESHKLMGSTSNQVQRRHS